MAKILRCSKFIPGCTFVATGKTLEEVFRHASEHVRLKHKFRGMSPEVMAILHGQVIEDDSNRELRARPHGDSGTGFWQAAAEK